MGTCLSAFLGEMTTRSVKFLISEIGLGVLLWAQIIFNEAMGRNIMNQAMLQQLGMLRDAMHRGHYTLGTLKYESCDEGDANDQVAIE